MATYFSGTSTGNRYQVGRLYEMNGSAYRANEDGSFTSQGGIAFTTDQGRTVLDSSTAGRTTQGSYGRPDVKWYADGRDAAAANAHGGGGVSNAAAAAAAGSRVPAVAAGASAGELAAVAPPRPVSSATSAAWARRFGAASGLFGGGLMQEFSGEDVPGQDYLVAGHHLVASPRSSNAELVEMRLGDGEFLSPAFFANWGIAIDDMHHNSMLRTYGTQRTYDPTHQREVQQAARDDMGRDFLGGLMQGWDALARAGDNWKAVDRAVQLSTQERNEANAARDWYTFEESRRISRDLPEDRQYQFMGFPGDWPSSPGSGAPAPHRAVWESNPGMFMPSFAGRPK